MSRSRILAEANAAMVPTTMPINVGVMPSTMTRPSTSLVRAPSAARIPISRLRRAMYETTL